MQKQKIKTQDEIITQAGTLYVVATPIGNLEDITLRAIRILASVDLIAAEDTRHTRKLLSHLEISAQLVSYYKDREASRAVKIINQLQKGQSVALVSDAGTPGIADPGHILVRQARAAGIRIVPIPGPSSLAAALSITGLENTPLIFLGFLPSKPAERRRLFKKLAQEQSHIMFFESPRRLATCLNDCLNILGDRQVFWGRELTKIHETLYHGSLTELVAVLDNTEQKGESVLVLTGAAGEEKTNIEDISELLGWYRQQGTSLKDAVRQVSRDLDLTRTRVYKKALQVWGETA